MMRMSSLRVGGGQDLGGAGHGRGEHLAEDGRVNRPWAVTVPAAFLLLAPLLQIASVHFAVPFLNFGEARPRAYMIHGIAAPVVGWMLWRARPRARFAFYIFASCELIRFWRHGLLHWEVPFLYAGLIALLYTPAARAALPVIRPTERLAAYARLWPGRKRPSSDSA
jgi:hypothetical protein